MFCSACGTQNVAGARACSKCGSALQAASLPAAPYLAQQPPQVIVVRSGKSAGLAAVLSFLWCGLGQIYNGQIGKGIGFLVAYGVSIVLMFVLIGFITTPILWVWGMVDAYKTSERLNREAGLG